MNYETWEAGFPEGLRDPLLWHMKAYRLAHFISDIGWQDVSKLASNPRTVKISSQLYAALGSISSNIAEGHSRSSGRDRARIHEYALGSAMNAANGICERASFWVKKSCCIATASSLKYPSC